MNRGTIEADASPDGGTTAGAVTTWGYDGANDVTSMTDPLGNVSGATASDHTSTYVYDAPRR